MSQERPRSLMILTGPTGSGKSTLALSLARQLSGEIVNADSVQLYKHFDIGSAKPEQEDFEVAPHYLFSVLSPDEPCSAGRFVKLARVAIDSIFERGNLPIIVGGTGLYIRSLMYGLADETRSRAAEGKASFEEKRDALAARGLSEEQLQLELYNLLESTSPETASTIHPNDAQRTQRALEVFFATGKSLRGFEVDYAKVQPYCSALIFVLEPGRKALYQQINARVDAMLERGLVDEVRCLSRNFSSSSPPFRSIGYSHVLDYLEQKISYDTMIETIKRDTRRFAKRQFTWWRNQPGKLNWKVSELQACDDLAAAMQKAWNNFLPSRFEAVAPQIECIRVMSD